MNDYEKLTEARAEALKGSLEGLLQLASDLLLNSADVSLLLSLGMTLQEMGFVSAAAKCFNHCRMLDASCGAALVNLATVAHSVGDHNVAAKIYEQLLRMFPGESVIRRNCLTMMEYDPQMLSERRFELARGWGDWAIAKAGGWLPRADEYESIDRPLRVGYVSSDICQHTVGLFLKPVLMSHDRQRVNVFVYSAGQHRDWLTETVKSFVLFRDVSNLNDKDLAGQIFEDQIDVLVDVSGHTAGSRLSAFAYRPAPVLVSWLGYFATTGLPYMDAVFLDEWHTFSGVEAQFVEQIVKLPFGRFCYEPVPWAPHEVSSLPYFKNGYIIFGCFNNTAKLNDEVFAVWSRILNMVPMSKLILKWRTFNDIEYKDRIWAKFSKLGISKDRVELRRPSFHKDLLLEYADIDIALDPFPFCGGLTTCESLWMGVPVVTFPQDRVVSRQSHALLNAIGLGELSARDCNDYVRIAVDLAGDPDRLHNLRSTMRERMRGSPLMDLKGFTKSLEDSFISLFKKILHQS